MKAMQYTEYGDADVMRMAEVADPEPGPGQILIDIHAASVNPVDWKIRSGAMRQFFDVEFPVVPGRDGAGIVAAAGPDVSDVAVGDEVCFIAGHLGQGTYAERIVLDAAAVAPKPANISFAEAAAFPLAGMTAWAALVNTAPVELGAKVLIHSGSGGVGGIAIQLAKHSEAGHITATCSAANVDYVLGLGANRAIAYDAEDFAETVTDCDLVFDTFGGDIHKRSYEVMRMGGTLVWITALPVQDLSQQHGVTSVQAPVRPDPDGLKALAALVGEGEVKPQVGEVLPLADAAKAHRISETGHVRGKIVLQVR
jgi:NADPH:quinone reductase-like Zn-dependent oxidoreductase